MSVKGEMKEAAGFVKEEAYEHGKSSESQKKAQGGPKLAQRGSHRRRQGPEDDKAWYRSLKVNQFFIQEAASNSLRGGLFV